MGMLAVIGILLWLVFVVCVVSATYYYFKSKFSVWRSQDIAGPRPYPFFGTSLPILVKGIVQADLDTVRTCGRIVGIYEGGLPGLLVTDDALMREVLFKDSSNFVNRRPCADRDDVYAKMLNVSKDDDWRRLRRLLTPIFSTGKLSQMIHRIGECTNLLLDNIGVKADADLVFELKDLCAAFTLDVIGSTVFGVDCSSHRDVNSDFAKYGQELVNFYSGNPFAISFRSLHLRRYMSKLGMSTRDKEAERFFASIVHRCYNSREKENEVNRSFIQLLRDAHKEGFHSNEEGLTELEVLAQSLMLLLAGFDNTATALALLMYNLACNLECQDKLFAELQEALTFEEELTYNKVQGLGYLDMCLQESLRLYPPVSRIERIASNDVTVNGIHLPKGSFVAVPIHAIHMDPEIWPEPSEFIPERFLPEKNTHRNPLHHLPFGYGPRSCIAMRLATLEVKMAAVQIIRNFKIIATDKTQIPWKFQTSGFIKSQNGIRVKAYYR